MNLITCVHLFIRLALVGAIYLKIGSLNGQRLASESGKEEVVSAPAHAYTYTISNRRSKGGSDGG